jgi:hypothetical protein
MAQQINLFDPALQRQRDWLALPNVVAGAVALIVFVGVAGTLTRQGVPALQAQVAGNETQLKALRDQITAQGQQLANRKPDPRIEQELATAKLLLETQGEVLKVLQRGMGTQAMSYADTLRGFARQTLPGLWLTGVHFAATAGDMTIEGGMTDPALLPEYIRRLNREQAFQGRSFAALQMAGSAQTPDKTPPTPSSAPADKQRPFHTFRLIPRLTDKGGAQHTSKGNAQAYLEGVKAAGGAS